MKQERHTQLLEKLVMLFYRHGRMQMDFGRYSTKDMILNYIGELGTPEEVQWWKEEYYPKLVPNCRQWREEVLILAKNVNIPAEDVFECDYTDREAVVELAKRFGKATRSTKCTAGRTTISGTRQGCLN